MTAADFDAEANLIASPAATALAGGELALSGPSEKIDRARRPVRGDLAHIRCAGRVFVPHYVVPLAHAVVDGGATLRRQPQPEGEALAELAAGASFQVLDIAGGWAWGQEGGPEDEDGLVGYVPMDRLVPSRP